MLAELSTLAQSADLERLLTKALPWSVAVLAAIVVLAVVVRYLRRRLQADQGSEEQLWTLQDLREMLARGDLGEEEFQRLKARVVAQAQGVQTPGSGGPRGAGGGGSEGEGARRLSEPEKADADPSPLQSPGEQG
jgi:hypothetical protein